MASTTPPDLFPDGAGHLRSRGATADAQLAALAVARHLVMSLSELDALGMSRHLVAAYTRRGRLHRVHRRVYSLIPPGALDVRGRYRAATLACSGSRHLAALSHRSAADLWGLRACHRRVVEVIVPGRSTHRHAGIQVHRSINLVASELNSVDGIRVTSVARTLLDLAAVVPARGLERALDRAEILQIFDLESLIDQLKRNPGHPGAGRLRAALNHYRIGSAVTESELEEAFVAFCRAYEFPLPELHGPIDPGGKGVLLRPDAVWRNRRVVLEVDGERFHRTHRAFQEDRVRDQRLVAAGWRVIRTTWEQLTERPHELVAALRTLLRDA